MGTERKADTFKSAVFGCFCFIFQRTFLYVNLFYYFYFLGGGVMRTNMSVGTGFPETKLRVMLNTRFYILFVKLLNKSEGWRQG